MKVVPMRILAVDDDPIVLDLLEVALTGASLDDLTRATSAEEALDLIDETEESFECILLDINMPGIDGIELCRRVREYPEYETVPIIMITRLDHRSYLEKAIRMGASDYVVKPFDGTEVVTRIELAALRRARDADQIPAQGPIPLTDPVSRADRECAEFIELPAALSFETMKSSITFIPEETLLKFSAIKIANFDALRGSLSRDELSQAIMRVGRSVATRLKGTDFMMAYAGAGTIVAVVRGLHQTSASALGSSLQAALLETVPTEAVIPEIVVATAGPSNTVHRQDRMTRIRYAIYCADEAARETWSFGKQIRATVAAAEELETERTH
ncbi:Response regulator receiver domain-containing protein [Roseivivax halotolerans]|uniref:Response regulator receiver domain-containing protein n=1 Tax=Roseivivax halotolerans TaxID=93684 RepID=A0A1I5XCA7_9RHOB|nr:response regulator [Roseivivax halotolerans]SFQ29287.1 Response regulator receiver domain-containing protein [Roseivivax halotolerans]